MKRDNLKIALAVSIVFNAAVLIAFAYGIAKETNFIGKGRTCKELAPNAFALHGHRFARRIGIHEERAAKFACLMQDTSGRMRGLRSSLQLARRELISMLESSDTDTSAIMAKVDEIARLQGELEKEIVSRLLDARALLTREERSRFMMFIRSRCLCNEPERQERTERCGEKEEL